MLFKMNQKGWDLSQKLGMMVSILDRFALKVVLIGGMDVKTNMCGLV